MRRFLAAAAAVAALFGAAAPAAEVPGAVGAAIERHFPGFTPDSVAPAPVPGLFEVVFGPRVVYVSGDGRFLVRGEVIDLGTRENLTDARTRSARGDALQRLGESGMISFGPADARHTVTVFTDIDCPYCAKLHAEMADYNALGIRIRYLAYPRAGIASGSYRKAVSVWCADDRRQALTDAKARRPVPERNCENPVASHFALGRAIGISGTPSMVLEDGRMVPGYVPAKRLLDMIEQREPS